MSRLRVAIESPYGGNVERNVKYLKRCLQDSVDRGEAPFASHLFYTQFLDDTIIVEREIGIECGLEWAREAHKAAFYIDYGVSLGMLRAQDFYYDNRKFTEFRSIGRNPDDDSND